MPFEYKNLHYFVKKPEDFNLFQTLAFHPEHQHYLMWTLPLEISYYFILPLFVLAMLKMGRFWWMLCILLYVWVIHEGLYTTRDNFYRQPLKLHLPTFVVGFMASTVYVKIDSWTKPTGFKFRTLHTMEFESSRPVKLSLLFVIEMLQPSAASLIFEWAALRYLCKISFPVYLLHVSVIFTKPIKEQTIYYNRTFSIFGLVILLATGRTIWWSTRHSY
ncbi:hypothetical protein BBJ29_009911 [Phytophthora kernoviae]|uniref:Acyltransferase 3 domain-containing protein n=1 Tax=Phytophthora kernoviae TaxID=325452 RepID=A0A3F2RCZ4_9STRA|nr:hypothetical protein BBP00_00009314 [Phytophthora kernoviae]RLN55944.1 hypothetical protein BBJ29_009911 [Phytophthora kernoviae]